MSTEMVILECRQAVKLAEDSNFITVISVVLMIVLTGLMLEHLVHHCALSLRPKHRVFVEKF